MNKLVVGRLNSKEMTELVHSLKSGCSRQTERESLLRFVEYNRASLEERIEKSWGPDNVQRLYTDIVEALRECWYRQRDVRFLNILIKLADTKYYRAQDCNDGLVSFEFAREFEALK